jgi:transglutaminase-like putative cysteine protease
VTEDDPGAPLLRGFLLLVLLAGWLWLPRLGSREALAGAAVVAGVGILSLPLAAALDARNAWWDYRGWELFGESKSITFDWSHRYGPLDWPRRGTTLLNVRADPGQYWKAETLDRFDGLRWVRSREIQTTGVPEGLPTDLVQRGRTWEYGEWNDKWAEEIRFTVRSLSSNLILGAGTTLSVAGADPYVQATDGTTSKIGDPLEQGDSYTVRAYVPSPTAKQMRQAPAGYSPGLQDWTRIEVPQGFSGETATIELPLWGGGTFGDPDVPAELLAASPYARMYEAAREVTADSRTVYDAAKDVERYLDEVASYKEQVKRSEYPLVSFLFRDKVGYCQQFSGAMALMLRMVGIPARVAAGFSPGSLNRDTGEYRVRDFDAHSWVEVNINGIGWVRFDPTPSASPALAQSTDERRPGVSVPGGLSRDAAGSVIADAGSGGEGQAVTGEEGGIAPVVILLTLVLLGCGGLVAYRLYSRSRSMSPEDLAEAQLAELPRALARLGWELPRQTTLLGLERRFGRTAGPQAVRYAAALRAYRYHAGAPTPPGMSERRALRRELTSTGGWGARIRGLLAIPPGGPRPVR